MVWNGEWVVEAKLQELFWWCQGISKIIQDEFQGWRKQDVKQKQRSQDKNLDRLLEKILKSTNDWPREFLS